MGSSTGTAQTTQLVTDEDEHHDDWTQDEWWFPFTKEDNFS